MRERLELKEEGQGWMRMAEGYGVRVKEEGSRLRSGGGGGEREERGIEE